MTDLMHSFAGIWPYKNSMQEEYIVEDMGDCYRVIIKNSCEWQNRSGGCTMCNYSQRDSIQATSVLINASKRIINEILEFEKKYNKIKIYINGSFFNESELAEDVAFSFLRRLKNECGITNICVETRPEYLTRAKLLKYIAETRVSFEICFGIESTNERIRNTCINKGIDINAFYRLCSDINSICKIKVYLLVKPPFLTENEAIEDVVSSVNELINHGITSISYTPIAVQRNTLLEFLLQEGLYRPIWIWSLIEINTRLHSLRERYPEISLGSLDYYPEPLKTYFNCEKCNEKYVSLIMENRNITWMDIANIQCCTCYDKWLFQLKNEISLPIENQIELARELLEKNRARTQRIACLVGSDSIGYLTDVAKLVPEYGIKLDKVGVKDVRLPLMIQGFQVDGAIFSCSLELDEFHRGIHMSRLLEQLNEFSYDNHKDIISDLKSFLTSQGIINNSISLQCLLFKQVKRNLSGKPNYVSITLECNIQRSCFPNTIWESTISLDVPFINACPCTKVSAEELFEKSFTHTQRGRIRISFINTEIDFCTAVDFVEKYVGIFDLLKREDELYVVGNAHKNAQFCEDVCRMLSNDLTKKLKLKKGSAVINVVTEESIHPHQAFSEKSIDFTTLV